MNLKNLLIYKSRLSRQIRELLQSLKLRLYSSNLGEIIAELLKLRFLFFPVKQIFSMSIFIANMDTDAALAKAR
jgi:hypothetical protein